MQDQLSPSLSGTTRTKSSSEQTTPRWASVLQSGLVTWMKPLVLQNNSRLEAFGWIPTSKFLPSLHSVVTRKVVLEANGVQAAWSISATHNLFSWRRSFEDTLHFLMYVLESNAYSNPKSRSVQVNDQVGGRSLKSSIMQFSVKE